jgi:hypothetical protein
MKSAIIALFFAILGSAAGIGALLSFPRAPGDLLGPAWTEVSVGPNDEADINLSGDPLGSHRRALLLLARASIEARLNDPFSAVFDGVSVVSNEQGSEVVCGYVNAKNRLGAYAGRLPFAYEHLIDRSEMADGATPLGFPMRRIAELCKAPEISSVPKKGELRYSAFNSA